MAARVSKMGYESCDAPLCNCPRAKETTAMSEMREARVTYVMMRFADGTEVMAEFVNGKSIDDALASLRLASTGAARTLSIFLDQEELVEKVARAIAAEDNEEGFDAWEANPSKSGRRVYLDYARAALLAIREGWMGS